MDEVEHKRSESWSQPPIIVTVLILCNLCFYACMSQLEEVRVSSFYVERVVDAFF